MINFPYVTDIKNLNKSFDGIHAVVINASLQVKILALVDTWVTM